MSDRVRRSIGPDDAPNRRREIAYGLLVGVAALLVGGALDPSNYLEHILLSSGIAVAYVGFVASVDVAKR